MQTIDIWNQLNLYRRKVISLFFLFLLSSGFAMGQARFNEISKAGQDEKLVSYGFFLGGHTNYWRLKYSESFAEQLFNVNERSVQSIMPYYSPGFSLGFLVVFRLHDQVNFLITPKVGFYEYRTDINSFVPDPDPYTQEESSLYTTSTVINESTMVEIPILFKYKAQRFNNSRMFFTAGGSFMFRTKDQEEADVEDIGTLGRDFTVDLGIGFDMYFKFFKFSPEVRFSHGLLNMYRPEATDPTYSSAIESLRRKSITLYLNFQ
ncbi:porin family protein [Belliella kenyensis]|uniref:Porin family protein n=1 Tax=Belliella kenyensis TaxID=1472724 RepID=A0ABV8ERS1_9BACT|nr:porin family protein [Belliella kenyensis]MCH7402919.1 PorT family protein [Belliella kenyensis]MDN3602625.1 porin family protein [Belliella kenyensis]